MSEPPRHLHAVSGAADRTDRTAAIVAGLPEVFAGTAFDPADPVLAEVCSASSVMVLRTDALPVPMQREVSWWLATCHANGERVVNTYDWKRWVATAVEVTRSGCQFASRIRLPVSGRPPGRASITATTAGSLHPTPARRPRAR